MCKKIILGFAIIIFIVMMRRIQTIEILNAKNNSMSEEREKIMKQDNSIEIQENANIEEIENDMQEDISLEKGTEKTKSETITEELPILEETIKEVIEISKEQKDNVQKTEKEEIKTTYKEENNIKKEDNQLPGKESENKEEPKVEEKNEIQEEENKKENLINTEEKIKEKITYNKEATQKIINDIDELAKQNPSLWDKNGNKLYEIEEAESLVGQNYMYPYRKQHVAGVVLNVFPVKFLVYAIDVEKDGFTKETRYYIDVASLN